MVSKTPRAFVTGGSGFIGANLIRLLLDRGWQVRALVRDPNARNVVGLPVEPVVGALDDPGLTDALRDCDALFHVAALYSLWQHDRSALIDSNVVGTRHILQCARDAGVPRTVYTSSVSAIGVAPPGRIADETYQSAPEKLVGAYKRSKYYAEREALAAARAGQDVVIVNPSTPIGPYDSKPTPTGDIIVRFLRGGMPAYVQTGLNFVAVSDVALGHLRAYERGRSGERYILGNENLTMSMFLVRLAAVAGRRAPRTRIPAWLPLPIAWVDEQVLGRFGKVPGLSVDAVRMASQRMFYDTGKARIELGLPATPLEYAMQDAVNWFYDNGYVSARQGLTRDGVKTG